MDVQRIVLKDTDCTPHSFIVEQSSLRPPRPTECLVRPLYFGLNAGMRSRIGKDRDGAGTLHVGDTPTSDALVEVIEHDTESLHHSSPTTKLALVQWCPWSTHALIDKTKLIELPSSTQDLDPSWYLGFLGHTGFTAWLSLHLSKANSADHIIVSGAAGGVGSSLIQWAKAKGIQVSGLASHARAQSVQATLEVSCIDRDNSTQLPDHSIYHDGAGGYWLEQSINAIKQGGTIMTCGALSQEAPKNFSRIIHKDIHLIGYSVINHERLRQQFWREGIPLVKKGSIKPCLHKTEGLESMGQAFCSLSHSVEPGRSIVSMH